MGKTEHITEDVKIVYHWEYSEGLSSSMMSTIGMTASDPTKNVNNFMKTIIVQRNYRTCTFNRYDAEAIFQLKSIINYRLESMRSSRLKGFYDNIVECVIIQKSKREEIRRMVGINIDDFQMYDDGDIAFAPSALTEIQTEEHQPARNTNKHQTAEDTRPNSKKTQAENEEFSSESDDSDYTLHDSSATDNESKGSDDMPLANLVFHNRHSSPQHPCSGIRHATPPPQPYSPIQHSSSQPQCSKFQSSTPQPSTSFSSSCHVNFNPKTDNNIAAISSNHSFNELLPTPEIKTSNKGRLEKMSPISRYVVLTYVDKRGREVCKEHTYNCLCKIVAL
ncbi:hypothetical protein FQA39_LY08211 [Lamprigera yunnana]|nr:hypothetical protein FQA39_LY08211 [Lamprigera yunnana]